MAGTQRAGNGLKPEHALDLAVMGFDAMVLQSLRDAIGATFVGFRAASGQQHQKTKRNDGAYPPLPIRYASVF